MHILFEGSKTNFLADEESFGKPYILILAVVLVLLLVAASCPPAYMILVNSLDKSGSKKTKSYADKEHLAENGLVPNPYFTKENLKLEKLIGTKRENNF